MTDERMQFVARKLAGEPMSELCREIGISRKTAGYKIVNRYQECRMQGLTDRSRNRKSLRSKSVTHVLGTLCQPCLRAGPSGEWRA